MPETRPRIWPALVVGAGYVPLSLGVGVLFVLGLLAVERLVGSTALSDVLDQESTASFLAFESFGTVVDVAALLLLAVLSRESVQQRFAIGPGRLPALTILIVLFGGLLASSVGVTLSELVFASPSDIEVERAEAMLGGGDHLVSLLVVMAVLPAITEELVFRGYVQSRLLRRMPAAGAIAISSVCFAAAHLEPSYALGVLPVGAWLGYVAWISGSIRFSMVAHFCGNALAVVGATLLTAEGESEEIVSDPSVLELMFPLVLLWLCGRALHRWRRPERFVVPPLQVPQRLF